MNLSFLPNLITIMRVILLAPLLIFLLAQDYTRALVIFLIAGFSDALDGYLAKHFNWTSRFGAILDPLADKALLVLTMTLLAYHQHISWVLFSLVLFRDIYIIAGASYYHYRLGPYQMQPSYLSKLNTFVQIFLVTCLLVSLGYYPLPATFIEIVTLFTYLTTISSGVHYTWVWGKKLKTELALRKETSENNNSLSDDIKTPSNID